VPRILPNGLDAAIDLSAWRLPEIFGWLRDQANLAEAEMLSTFNCGIGLVTVVSADAADAVIAAFRDAGEQAFIVGSLTGNDGGESQVRFSGHLG
jgi:phosphoribosylformylglycinamidine cyclo-ligase